LTTSFGSGTPSTDERDRYRGLVHRANGYEVVRISADHVYDEPQLVLDALVPPVACAA
jgi:very-short-patch-repair endonuclease